MTRNLVGRIFMTGAVTGAIGLAPAAAMAQTNVPCPALAAPACSTFNTNTPTSDASNTGTITAPVSSSGSGPALIISSNSQTQSAKAASIAGNDNSIGGGSHRVNVGGRTFSANGSNGSFVSLGVGGASNTGGAAFAAG